ncbi:MAG: hypothetical protein AAGE38_14070 [Pseudomonadota bacterium]
MSFYSKDIIALQVCSLELRSQLHEIQSPWFLGQQLTWLTRIRSLQPKGLKQSVSIVGAAAFFGFTTDERVQSVLSGKVYASARKDVSAGSWPEIIAASR